MTRRSRRTLGLSVLLAALCALGLWFYRSQEASYSRRVEDELLAVAKLKVEQIAAWRAERLGDGAVLGNNPLFRRDLSRWLASAAPEPPEAIRIVLENLRRAYRYDNILVVSPSGRVLWSLEPENPSLDATSLLLLERAFRERRAQLSDLHEGPQGVPHLGLVVPFLDRTGTASRPVAGLVLVQQAQTHLYPLLRTWPVPSATAEALLVRREGDRAVYLNPLRHTPQGPLKLRLPLLRQDLPAVQAVRGTTGVVRGVDYRGEKVLAALLPVPDSPWFLETKVDVQEAFGNWRQEARLILALFGALLALLCSAGILLWRRDLQDQASLRTQAEAQRESSEERYRSLFEDHRAMMWVVDPEDGSIVDANPAAAAFYGWSREELSHMKVGRINTSPPGAIRKAMADGLAGSPMPFLFQHRLADGELRDVETYTSPISWGHRKLLFSIIHDVTDRLRLEREHRVLQDRLVQAQKMESVGRLAGGVAHDFNNMLQVILGTCNLILDQLPQEDPLREDLLEIHKAALRSAELTRQLLAFGRRQPAVLQVLDLNETITDLVPSLRRLAGSSVDLSWIPGEDLWSVRMDPFQVEQVLTNLTTNARDAISGFGRVRVETRNVTLNEDSARMLDNRPGDYVLLSLSDDGLGMSPEVREHAFEPFFSTKDDLGTGLGLSTVEGIVVQNGGFLHLDSELGEGTTFRIYLPRWGSSASPLRETPLDPNLPRGQGETILLVEDEVPILSLENRTLEALGYRVLAAETPEKALTLAAEHDGSIHLLVTDVVMPGMNGRELAENLWALEPGMKCLFMSGYTADIIARQGILDEEVQFLPKPFSMNDLAVKVREILRF
ncbi:PAS/PAC sensor hybrid histidine kinase [Aminomonas paucivorans DSM 12260]|uniref:histidine kinase n=1 Tax=Aminomonas paucivorans DSM 12260 TaxID=584708 RepID=E3CZB2_9BACT|nr:PAS domain S-box protein [Aminomonas paucivorans]EFQ24609.1 PAS/PAC sensor hybrid histidine kinase [Aminomonas paucivorans DSM 12260]